MFKDQVIRYSCISKIYNTYYLFIFRFVTNKLFLSFNYNFNFFFFYLNVTDFFFFFFVGEFNNKILKVINFVVVQGIRIFEYLKINSDWVVEYFVIIISPNVRLLIVIYTPFFSIRVITQVMFALDFYII